MTRSSPIKSGHVPVVCYYLVLQEIPFSLRMYDAFTWEFELLDNHFVASFNFVCNQFSQMGYNHLEKI